MKRLHQCANRDARRGGGVNNRGRGGVQNALGHRLNSGATDAQGGSHRTARAGYTLLELLISVVLLATLMSAVWGVLSMYNGLLTAGREQTEEQQLVRSVFQLLTEDLTLVVPGTPLPGPPSDDGASDSFPDLGSFTAADDATFPLIDAPGPRPAGQAPVVLGLSGTSSAIRMTIRRPQPPDSSSDLSDIDLLNALGGGSMASGEDAVDDGRPQVPEFQTIVYQWEAVTQIESPVSLPSGLYRIQADATAVNSLQTQRSSAEQMMADESTVALGRPALEALVFPQTGELDTAVSPDGQFSDPADVQRIPEVVGCRFEYFDGRFWQSAWGDGAVPSSGGLPAAVRVALDVAALPEVRHIEQLMNDSSGTGDSALERKLRPPFARSASRISRPVVDETSPGLPMIRARTYHRIMLLDSSPVLPEVPAAVPGGSF